MRDMNGCELQWGTYCYKENSLKILIWVNAFHVQWDYSCRRIYQYNKVDFRINFFTSTKHLNSIDKHNMETKRICEHLLFIYFYYENSMLKIKTWIKSRLHFIYINADHCIQIHYFQFHGLFGSHCRLN